MPYGRHIYHTAYDIAVEKNCAFPQSQHAFPNWGFVLLHFSQFPLIYIPGMQSYHHISNTCPKIRFYVYNMVSICTVHGIYTTYRDKCQFCLIVPDHAPNSKLCTIEELVIT